MPRSNLLYKSHFDDLLTSSIRVPCVFHLCKQPAACEITPATDWIRLRNKQTRYQRYLHHTHTRMNKQCTRLLSDASVKMHKMLDAF